MNMENISRNWISNLFLILILLRVVLVMTRKGNISCGFRKSKGSLINPAFNKIGKCIVLYARFMIKNKSFFFHAHFCDGRQFYFVKTV